MRGHQVVSASHTGTRLTFVRTGVRETLEEEQNLIPGSSIRFLSAAEAHDACRLSVYSILQHPREGGFQAHHPLGQIPILFCRAISLLETYF
jgi:hypothetical protein